jgi:hypothetical protein
MVFQVPQLLTYRTLADTKLFGGLLTLPSLDTASNALRAFIGGSFIELPFENLMSLSE